MGLFSKTVKFTALTSVAGALTFAAATRKSKIVPVSPTDYIFNTTPYARLNPQNSPYTSDICVRKVPLASIKPELLGDDTKLVEAFCAGVWSGLGFAYQRRFLEKKYRAQTAEQLWETKDLANSTYPIGTKITDHFEVVSKTPGSIMVRCGDSPRVQEPRDSDGIFEMTAVVNKDEGVVELGLKSVFFNSLSGYKTPNAPMPAWMQLLHQGYDKLLMETALYKVTK